MNHPLDFIVFGIPRSGTKALVRALNLHPNVYCAMERFHFRADHSRLTFPESVRRHKGAGESGRSRQDQADPARTRTKGRRANGRQQAPALLLRTRPH